MTIARKVLVEGLLTEATEEEQFVANLIDDTVDELEAALKTNKDQLAPQQNEAVGFAIAGSLISFPALLKLVGKAVLKLQKKFSGKDIDENTIIKIADKIHHIYIGALEKVLMYVFRIKDKKQAHRLAVIIFHAIVAGLLVASGKATFAALKDANWTVSFFEGLLSSIKSGELGAFIVAELGQLARALGLGAELADAADLADALEVISDAEEATEEITEMSTMAGGSVQGYSLPLGAKPEDYKMENKLRITKGRLRQILAEEVARHQKQKLNEAEGLDKEAMLRKIVDEEQAAKIEGTMVDLFSASAIVSVLDAINPANKERFLKLPVGNMASIAFKMMKEEKTDMLEEMGAAEEEAEASELRAEEEPESVVNEKKMTDKHDAEMKEKGFSDKQAKNLPDELQKSMLKEYEEVLVLKGDKLVIVDDEGNEKVMGDKLDAELYGLYKDGDSTVVSMGTRDSGYGRYGSRYRRYEESVIKEEVHKVLKQILNKK